MNKEIQVSASILCADFTKLADQIKFCEDAGVDSFHIDVMDGHFVPNITIGPIIVEAIRPLTSLPIETHLMIENPGMYLDPFMDAGADVIKIQVECYGPLKKECRTFGQFPKEVDSIEYDKMKEDLQRIRGKKKKAYAVVNPGSSPDLGPLLKDLDGVLLMSVNPGFAKQKFMPKVLPKVQQLREKFEGDIAVDGGINELTAPEVVKAGANILVTASYFFGAEKPKEVVKYLKGLK